MTEAPHRCTRCGVPIPQPTRGRHRLYCDDRCRRAAQRERARLWTWVRENQAPQPVAADPESVPGPESSDAAAVGWTLAGALAVVAELRRHGVGAAPKLAARCGALADAFDAALVEHFGDVLNLRE
jgi:hypothetical protein